MIKTVGQKPEGLEFDRVAHAKPYEWPADLKKTHGPGPQSKEFSRF